MGFMGSHMGSHMEFRFLVSFYHWLFSSYSFMWLGGL